MALPLNLDQFAATIPNGTALSGAVPMGADTLVGIQMPAAWTAANITFQVSPDGGTTWCNLYDDAGNEVTITNPQAGAFIVFNSHPSTAFYGVNMFKVRSGTNAAPVNQGADRALTLVGRPLNY